MHRDVAIAPRLEGMRIALVHPTYWPEVRRGSERFIHDLATYLAGRAHDVTVLTSHRGRPQRSREGGFTVVRGRRLPPRLEPPGTEPHIGHAPFAFLASALRRFDLLHVLHIPDAWAVSSWSRLVGRPLVLSLMGYPDAASLDGYRFRRAMLTRVAKRAQVHTLSEAAAAALRHETAIEAVAVHPGTDPSAFAVDLPRAEHPTVFCAASPADPRKRVPLLVEAFARVRRALPDVRLVIDVGPDFDLHADLGGPGVEAIDARAEGLERHYARSWVTVLPSAREAFGLVLVESLAAGTPAVGILEGGVPEILDRPGVGALADVGTPDVLARAILDALDLSRGDGIREKCRVHARRWDWRRIGPQFESLYADAIARARRGAARV